MNQTNEKRKRSAEDVDNIFARYSADDPLDPNFTRIAVDLLVYSLEAGHLSIFLERAKGHDLVFVTVDDGTLTRTSGSVAALCRKPFVREILRDIKGAIGRRYNNKELREKLERVAEEELTTTDWMSLALVKFGEERYEEPRKKKFKGEKEFELHDDGFTIYRGMLGDNVAAEYHEFFDDESRRFRGKKRFIFNNEDADDEENDKKRIQMEFSHLEGKQKAVAFENLVAGKLRTLHSNYEIKGMVVLRSKPGCLPQITHIDYPPLLNGKGNEVPWNDEDVPLACLIALEDHTYLDVWVGAIRYNQRQKFQHQRLVLNAGDVLVFRGDLVHGGAAYEQINVRVHCYLEPEGFKRQKQPDDTEVTYYVDSWKNILPRSKE